MQEGRFAHIVVDPAPTGHLIRLLEMPALALDWSHRLMRLMLKYRGVAGLVDTAQELLDFATRMRALDALLHDRARAGLVIVMLDEPIVRNETARLVAAVRARNVDVAGVICNRIEQTGESRQAATAPLPVEPPVPQLLAAATIPPPVGVAALRSWSHGWHYLIRPS